MSMGTIVTIVLMVTVLIIGLVFVRNTMCAGISLSTQITDKYANEIKGLYGADEYGVKCMGEGGEQIKLGDGGTRQIGCMILTQTPGTYKLEVTGVKSLKGASDQEVQSWVLDKSGFNGLVPVGQSIKVVLVLNIPAKTQLTTLAITVRETSPDAPNGNDHQMYIDVTPVGTIASAVC